MSNKKVVIIGSGLGGLSCGVILAKNGYDVTILEQSHQIGGCLQCFTRNGVKFETGMHFIGSADKGQTLDKLMTYLEIRDKIELSELDRSGYDVISIGGREYKYANGKENFIQQMSEYFPSQRENLHKYFDIVEKVASASSVHSLKFAESDVVVNTEFQLRTINEVIDEVISDKRLADVLVGNLPLYAAEKDKTPFSVHAFITDFYNQSAYRIVGGSDLIAKALSETLNRYNGTIRTKAQVTKIICSETKATGVEINGSDFISADFIISDIHPQRTFDLIGSKLIRLAFKNRVKSIPQTIGGFSVYLDFKDDAVPYMNYNYYGYCDDSPWGCETYDNETWPKGFLYMHFCHELSPVYAKAGVILSYMRFDELQKWYGTSVGKRGQDYEDFKKNKAQKLLSSIEKQIPGITDSIRNYYTSTPLTYYDYTGSVDGSMYGNAKDVTMGAAGRIPHKTKIPNLFLTGQNINSHGMLGVLVGTIITCSEFLSSQKIYEQIEKANL